MSDLRLRSPGLAQNPELAHAGPTPPNISVVVCVYNNWDSLVECLESLEHQEQAPSFEVIIVDDGSIDSVPTFVTSRNWTFPRKIISQEHAGVAVARNTGIQAARGALIVFTDCDCILDKSCLHNVFQCSSEYPSSNCFQCLLVGDSSHLVGTAEHLHLSFIQQYRRSAAGEILYLNTAGAAIRRSRINTSGQLFNPLALRAEDTYLLADLIKNGELPRHVSSAMVLHNVRLSIRAYLWKGIRAGYLEGRGFRAIDRMQVCVRVSLAERLKMVAKMFWQHLFDPRLLASLALLILRQSLALLGSILYRVFNRDLGVHNFKSGLSQQREQPCGR